MDSLIFPETEARLICQSFPKFCFWFFWRQSYITTFSTCSYIPKVITPGIIYIKSFHISPVPIFLIIPVYLKSFWGEQKGGMRNGQVPLKRKFSFRQLGIQSYNNPFCSYWRNPTLFPKASLAVLDKEKWLCCYCHLVLQGYTEVANPLCIHYHRLSIRSNWQVRRKISFQKYLQYIAENETSTHLVYYTLLKHTPTHKQRVKKRCVCPCLPTRRMCPKRFPLK